MPEGAARRLSAFVAHFTRTLGAAVPYVWFIVSLALLCSLGCVAAALRRLMFVYGASSFDADTLLRSLRGNEGRARGRAIASSLEAAAVVDTDQDLYVALSALSARDVHRGDPDLTEDERMAHVNAALLELDFRFDRWARVPRVCASISSSVGFLLASWALRTALMTAPSIAEESFNAALQEAINGALGVAAIGAAGTVTCLSVFYEARRVWKARRAATEKLVDRLEQILTASEAPLVQAEALPAAALAV